MRKLSLNTIKRIEGIHCIQKMKGANTISFFLVVLFMGLINCNQNVNKIELLKIPTPDNWCDKNQCGEAFAVKKFYVNDTVYLQKLHKLVYKNLNINEITSHKGYGVSIYQFDENEYEIIIKDNEVLNKRSIQMKHLIDYIWSNGEFSSVYFYKEDGEVVASQKNPWK